MGMKVNEQLLSYNADGNVIFSRKSDLSVQRVTFRSAYLLFTNDREGGGNIPFGRAIHKFHGNDVGSAGGQAWPLYRLTASPCLVLSRTDRSAVNGWFPGKQRMTR